jgi:hypothetical protein
MKIITLLSFLALATIPACERGPTSAERGLEDLVSDMEADAQEKEAEIQHLTRQLDMADVKSREIGELAKVAHSKVVDVNIAALELGNIANPELKSSAAMVMIMRNEAAQKACDELLEAIEKQRE